MKPIIEFCMSNIASGSKDAFEKLDNDPDLDVIEYGCLSFCGQCARMKFALVNGEMVTGQTNDELVENVYQFLEENPMF
ncbi:YuzB family protein [Salisediminibacterium halotolerans]|uniref:UPF0349 protein SAMN05444126_1445 n=1 Tax=Salisediminibacterium halotolerans TaxID=517425 RepID=A0A1H9WR54_9BACI|nr:MULTISPECIES: YuzB family protein [Salisediminibacterium]RLJ75385.1 uncharacterized protein YuzB (UPF0349 family) [Actinophytocola xinjiangensis]RPE89239.1 uncharacterized protein YuzB (UPF0349 family) [Salisediminibacterium halotolerans]TWG35998.1 uncharacterized protein YuzB (UPF0349 family) [Salisediminibacterium halotolerans]SES36365.1 Uncharacterized protein YuzB, UPF0349 family [Salisediminibacterium haloalkalitolerans]